MTRVFTASRPCQTVPLRRNRDYLLLMTGGTISGLGSQMTALTFSLLAFSLTHRAGAVGVVTGLEMAAYVITGVVAGAVVDRHSRRRIMVLAALAAATAYATVVWAIAENRLTVTQLAIVAVIGGGVAAAFYAPADRAALRAVVPPDQMAAASAAVQARMGVASLVGGPLAGSLYAVARFVPVLGTVLTSLVAALCARMVRGPVNAPAEDPLVGPADEAAAPTGESGGEGLWASVRGGWAFIWRHRTLRPIMVAATVLNFSGAGFILGLVIVLQQRGAAPAVVGLVESALAIAMIVGAAVSGRVLATVAAGPLLAVTGWILVATPVCVALGGSTVVLLIVLASSGLVLAPLNTALSAYQMVVTPAALQGRVASAGSTIAMAAQPAAPLAAGLMLEWLGMAATFWIFAGLIGVGALMLTVSRPVRAIPRIAEVTAD